MAERVSNREEALGWAKSKKIPSPATEAEVKLYFLPHDYLEILND